jgi:TRAP-type C4-dicarboxylate transport system permease small subunit
MEAFLAIFPKKVQQVLIIFTEIVTIVFMGVVLVPGIQFAIHTGHVPSSAMGIPMYWVYFAFPVGMTLGMLRMTISVVQQCAALRKKG